MITLVCVKLQPFYSSKLHPRHSGECTCRHGLVFHHPCRRSSMTCIGIPSKFHFESDAKENPEEEQEWRELLEDYPGRPTMNRRLFQLLYSEKLGLQRRFPNTFGSWSKPQAANLWISARSKRRTSCSWAPFHFGRRFHGTLLLRTS